MVRRRRVVRVIRVVRILAVLGALAAALIGGLLVRLRAGPMALPFLDGPIAAALGALAPERTAEIGSTMLARAGRGVALRVADVRLRDRDGTVLLSLPAVAVRPSLGALLRGRVVIARLDVADAALAVTRGDDGAWRLGASGAPLDRLAGGETGSGAGQGVPRIHLTRTTLTIDDTRGAGRVRITDGDVLVSARDGRLVVTVEAVLDLDVALPPVPGRLRLPMRAALDAPLLADGGLGDVTFTLSGDGGELAPAGDPGKPFPIAALAAEGGWFPAADTLRFGRLTAAVGTSRVDSKATVVLGATPFVTLDGSVDALPLAAMTRLWPAGLAASVRTWLRDNLPAGTLRRCRVQLAVYGTAAAGADEGAARQPSAARPSAAAAPPPAYDVACDFDGVTASYLRPLDPIREATGSARLTPDRLQVEVGTGTVGAAVVDGGTLAMDLTVDPPRATIGAFVHGAAADVLALVDRPPLELASPLGFVPSEAGGTSRVEVRLGLPIAREVAAEAVTVEATAHLESASLPRVAGGVGFRDGALTVRVDGPKVVVEGTAVLTGLATVTRPVTVALGTTPGATAGERHATIMLDGPDVAARGKATFAQQGLSHLAVERLRVAGSDVAGSVRRLAGGGWEATLTGKTLDLAALLEDPRLADDRDAAALDYAVRIDLEHVRARDGREVRRLRGTVAGTGGRLDALALDGSLVPSGTFQARLAADAGGPRAVHVTASDAGVFLGTFLERPEITGGRLTLEAHTDARGPTRFLAGALYVDDFKVGRAPVLAKILSVGSLGGIAALLQGGGLPVAKAHVPFTWDGGRLLLTEVRAIGAIGLTADGAFDVGREPATCDVRGNVIPAYTLNSALGRIPLIGRFLVGGKGQGVFGIDYHVSGRTADPQVRVNPLTSIAPTVLRQWFVDPFRRR